MIHIKKYAIGWIAGGAIGLAACTADSQIDEVIPGDSLIHLSGMTTRSGGTTTTGAVTYPLQLIAKADKSDDLYIPEKSITYQTSGSEDKESIITIDGGNALYYPINNQTIRFFAYTGKAANGLMTLNAGTDALLSNDGIRTVASTRTFPDATANEGQGTPGSSDEPADILYFRHVMTRLNVAIKVDNSDPTVTAEPKKIELTIADAIQQGTYPITAKTVENGSRTKATGTNNSLYTIKKGDNYLVSNGATLTNIQSLKIDDYTATAEDIKGFKIEPVNGTSNSLELYPGYAYNLTFTVKRLKVTGIRLEKVDWNTEEITNNDVSYTPKTVTLDLGSYNQLSYSAADTISKVVLYDNSPSPKQYVGSCVNGKGSFVVLPSAISTVDLYTNRGLLVSGTSATFGDDDATVDKADKKLTLPLSEGGMLLQTPGSPNSDSNPYLVQNALQLLYVSKEPAAHYKQVTDLDMETLQEQTTSSLKPFSGSYNGNGHQILHLNVKGSGLFESNSGTLENIRIVSGKIDASGKGNNAGGICGDNSGTIVACTNQAWIINAAENAGGICGNNSGTLIACLNTGNIRNGNTVGGICGNNTNPAEGAITACVNTGMLNRNAGILAGICGKTDSGSDTKVLKVCYWLTGTAEKEQGKPDTPGTDNNGGLGNETGVNGISPDFSADVADLSPDKLRDKNTAEETSTTTTHLNNAIPAAWNTTYHFVYNPETNGCTWPIPIKQ